MLGWMITVEKPLPWWKKFFVTRAARTPCTLANWEVGPSGLDWIDALVATGRAVQLRRDGYPNRYEVMAQYVLPFLTHDGIQQQFGSKFARAREINVYPAPIRRCSPHIFLTVEAWDQS